MVPAEGVEPPCPKTTGSKPVAYAFRHAGVVLGAVLEPASSGLQPDACQSRLTERKLRAGRTDREVAFYHLPAPTTSEFVVARTTGAPGENRTPQK